MHENTTEKRNKLNMVMNLREMIFANAKSLFDLSELVIKLEVQIAQGDNFTMETFSTSVFLWEMNRSVNPTKWSKKTPQLISPVILPS